MSIPCTIPEREYAKFKECPDGSGNTAVRVCLEDTATTTAPSTNVRIINVTTPVTADTEFSIPLTNKTIHLEFRVRSNANLKFTYTSGESGTNYYSLPFGTTYSITNVNLQSKTLYLQCNKASQIVEVIEHSVD